MQKKWWHKSVVYQIYPRSFYDSNGDGIGDLRGIIQKLDYIANLGVDVIWLCPIFKSPNDDNGYDISDYRSIMPEFGTMEDLEELIREANERNIKILLDLVPNHTSDEHAWFVEARKSRDNEYRDYYIWRDPVDGHEPNDLKSIFSGSAWEYDEVTGQYYLHMFSKKQPDLNWENPRVRNEMYDIMNFWLDKGIAGFRIDVIEMIGKKPDEKITTNGPRLHEYIREMNQRTFGKKELLTVGECWDADPEIAKIYTNPDGSELSMIFQFEHFILDQVQGKEKWDLRPLNLLELKKVLSKWQTALKDSGWIGLCLNNHDLPRIVSRWGNDGVYREVCAKMFATLLYGMWGTPFIYQGEELGMTNVKFPSIDYYKDVETINLYHDRLAKGYSEEEIMNSIYAKGRDNARTPMQWSDDINGGFTTGRPWIGVNPNYTTINAMSQINDSNSIYNYYKKIIAIRKQKDVLIYGEYQLILEDDENIFAYLRKLDNDMILVICNFADKPAEYQLPEELDSLKKELLIGNYPDIFEACLQPYEARMYQIF